MNKRNTLRNFPWLLKNFSKKKLSGNLNQKLSGKLLTTNYKTFNKNSFLI
jgi:hypothetical protein